MRTLNTALAGLALLAAACSPSTVSEESGAKVAADSAAQTAADAAAHMALEGPAATDFTLTDSTGASHSLRDAMADGKTVVLEWFNPECPVVRKFHEPGDMLATYEAVAGDDVVWMAVNSGGPGLQGAGADKQNAAIAKWNLPYPVLLDESGEVGKAYGATNTPHMFVIKDGVVVYRGAYNSSQQVGEGENYVISAVTALRDGRMPETTSTKAFGCSVKYAN